MEGVPKNVHDAIVREDAERIRALAAAGGRIAGEKKRAARVERDEQNEIHDELVAEREAQMHARSMQEAADARRDHELPAD